MYLCLLTSKSVCVYLTGYPLDDYFTGDLSISISPVNLSMSILPVDLPSTYTLSVYVFMSSLLDLSIHIYKYIRKW